MKSQVLTLSFFSLIFMGCGENATLPPKIVTQSISHAIFSNDSHTMLKENNKIRASLYAGRPLNWSQDLANNAQNHANALARSNTFRHSNTRNGENLFATSGKSGYVSALKAWYGEKDNYNLATNTCKPSKVCGHYTQIVWKDSKEVGCGQAKSASWGTITVCQYSPAGNYRGQKPY
jgi:pathogenesis-related protein 1